MVKTGQVIKLKAIQFLLNMIKLKVNSHTFKQIKPPNKRLKDHIKVNSHTFKQIKPLNKRLKDHIKVNSHTFKHIHPANGKMKRLN